MGQVFPPGLRHLAACLMLLVAACQGASDDATERAERGPPRDATSPLTRATPPGPAPIGSEDLQLLYRTLMDSYVDRIDPQRVFAETAQGAYQAAEAAGLLPVETALLSTATADTHGNPDRGWAEFLTSYEWFLRKLGGRIDVSPVGVGAVRGMLRSIDDPLTTYVDPATVQRLRSTNDASIGVALTARAGDDPPIIRAVVPGGPADRTGLRPGDAIMAVDGRPVGYSIYYALERLSGPAGSPVTITIRSPSDSAPTEVSLERVRVRFPPVRFEPGSTVAYFRLSAFDPGVAATVRAALLENASPTIRSWVIDLRGNGEGSLQEAVNLLSLFIGEQTLGIEEDRTGRRVPIPGTSRALSNLRPLVLLTDRATAGPAELFAAAIQDYGLGRLVGTPTAGRMGTTRVVPLPNGSVVQIASGRFLSPSGARLLGPGLAPDILVEATAEALASGADEQLERALGLPAQP